MNEDRKIVSFLTHCRMRNFRVAIWAAVLIGASNIIFLSLHLNQKMQDYGEFSNQVGIAINTVDALVMASVVLLFLFNRRFLRKHATPIVHLIGATIVINGAIFLVSTQGRELLYAMTIDIPVLAMFVHTRRVSTAIYIGFLEIVTFSMFLWFGTYELPYLIQIYIPITCIALLLMHFRYSLDNSEVKSRYKNHEFSKLTHRLEKKSDDLTKMVTDLKKANRELEQAEKRIKAQQEKIVETEKQTSLVRVSAGLAHEVNNPLAVIEMSSNLLRRRAENGNLEHEKAIDLTNKISVGVKRIAEIVQTLRLFAKTKNGSVEGRRDSKINTIVSSALLRVAKKYVNSAVAIQVVYEKNETRKVKIDRVFEESLYQLLCNSMTAVNAASEEWIRVEVKESEGFLVVKVIDSGLLEKKIASKIFDPFFTTKEVGQGKGLGLSYAKGTVAFLGGKVELLADEKNTTVQVRLPLSEVAEPLSKPQKKYA